MNHYKRFNSIERLLLIILFTIWIGFTNLLWLQLYYLKCTHLGGCHFLWNWGPNYTREVMIFDDLNVGSHKINTDSVYFVLKFTDINSILACLGGKVYLWWWVIKFLLAKYRSNRLFVNLGPPSKENDSPLFIGLCRLLGSLLKDLG